MKLYLNLIALVAVAMLYKKRGISVKAKYFEYRDAITNYFIWKS